MLNDYHALRSALSVKQMPDNMVHDLAAAVELKALEAGIKVQEIAMLYESLRRQEPRVREVTITDRATLRERVG
jgi:hypothetical protein